MRLSFHPFADKGSVLAKVFGDDTARTLYLLWRRDHIIGKQFVEQVWDVAQQIKIRKPATPEELAECFFDGTSVRGAEFGREPGDVRRWCHDVWLFFVEGTTHTVDYTVMNKVIYA